MTVVFWFRPLTPVNVNVDGMLVEKWKRSVLFAGSVFFTIVIVGKIAVFVMVQVALSPPARVMLLPCVG
jgi:hypothetical protein